MSPPQRPSPSHSPCVPTLWFSRWPSSDALSSHHGPSWLSWCPASARPACAPGVWSQALARVGFLIRASCHHRDRGRPLSWDGAQPEACADTAPLCGLRVLDLSPFGASLTCPFAPWPRAFPACNEWGPTRTRSGGWGCILGPAESPRSYGPESPRLTALGLVPWPAGRTDRFLPHLGHPKRADTVLSHDLLQRVLMATQGSGGHPSGPGDGGSEGGDEHSCRLRGTRSL